VTSAVSGEGSDFGGGSSAGVVSLRGANPVTSAVFGEGSDFGGGLRITLIQLSFDSSAQLLTLDICFD
jgi:hypothetical protein